MSRLTVLIVDDEPPARRKIRRLLEAHPEVEVVGEAGDGAEALDQIAALAPELVFLDVQMPHLTGLELLETLPIDARPHIVFTTAYDTHAVAAFEQRALDYLLKPFERERFAESVRRALEVHARRDPRSNRFVERFLVRERDRLVPVSTQEVIRFAAAEKYVDIFTAAGVYLHRMTMNTLEAQLGPEHFLRIHRSHIVRVREVRELQAAAHGAYAVVLRDGTRLPVGRAYRRRCLERLGADAT